MSALRVPEISMIINDNNNNNNDNDNDNDNNNNENNNKGWLLQQKQKQ